MQKTRWKFVKRKKHKLKIVQLSTTYVQEYVMDYEDRNLDVDRNLEILMSKGTNCAIVESWLGFAATSRKKNDINSFTYIYSDVLIEVSSRLM